MTGRGTPLDFFCFRREPRGSAKGEKVSGSFPGPSRGTERGPIFFRYPRKPRGSAKGGKVSASCPGPSRGTERGPVFFRYPRKPRGSAKGFKFSPGVSGAVRGSRRGLRRLFPLRLPPIGPRKSEQVTTTIPAMFWASDHIHFCVSKTGRAAHRSLPGCAWWRSRFGACAARGLVITLLYFLALPPFAVIRGPLGSCANRKIASPYFPNCYVLQ